MKQILAQILLGIDRGILDLQDDGILSLWLTRGGDHMTVDLQLHDPIPCLYLVSGRLVAKNPVTGLVAELENQHSLGRILHQIVNEAGLDWHPQDIGDTKAVKILHWTDNRDGFWTRDRFNMSTIQWQ